VSEVGERFPRYALIVIAAATALRMLVAFRIPLLIDETYYWSWSRHLAFGYTDHPPAVAWLIALTSALGQSPGVVRLPFIACEALAAIALGRAAMLLSGSARAGAAAAIGFTLIPYWRLALGQAIPDGPYLLCWALALWFVARAVMQPSERTMIPLGLALGGAILSRFFGWVLIAGITAFMLAPERRPLWRKGFALALFVAVALYVPFLAWDAMHGWQNLAFTFRAPPQAPGAFWQDSSTLYQAIRFLIYVAVLWLVGFFVAIRPKLPLVAWTALPFPTLLAGLTFFGSAEPYWHLYWLLGPLTSLCVGIGIGFARLPLGWRRFVTVAAALPATYMTVAMLLATLPQASQAASSPYARQAQGEGWFEFGPLAQDVRALTDGKASVLTDHYEIAAELYYYGVRSIMIGATPEVDQWNGWRDVRPDAGGNQEVLIIRFEPLEQDARLSREVALTYRSVRPGPILRYPQYGLLAFYTTWCAQPRKGSRIR
jgi:dolichyl-phosphate-mannose-protein mannosyltransferase